MHKLIPLDALAQGRAAKIGRLEGCPKQVKRLEEMGMRCGSSIEVVRCGRPCIIRVGCNRLCFRRHEMVNVWVRELDSRLELAPQP